jgi:hypothetical protein
MLTRKNVGITSKNFDEKMLAPLLKNVDEKCWQTSEKCWQHSRKMLTKKCWNTFEKC